MNTPPPPPPHGEVPKSSGLPPGKYDIFIIPQHSSGSGFLYLPSLKPNTNSFAAGFASALILVVIGQALAPAAQAWWADIKGSGGAGMMLLVIAIAIAAWALGRTQVDGGPGPGGGPSGGVPGPDAGTHGNTHSGPQPNGYANAPPPPPRSGAAPGAGGSAGGARPAGGWQRSGPPPGTQRANDDTSSAEGASKGAWERAREETKRKEEERKREEAARKRREEIETKLREAREKEAREREARERRQQQNEAQAKERIRREKAEAEEKIRRELEKERQELMKEREKVRQMQKEKEKEEERQAKEKELEAEKERARQKEKEEKAKLWEKRKEEMRKITAARLQAEKDKAAQQEKETAAAATKPVSSSYAFSATGEKTNPWPNGRPVSPITSRFQPPSPTKQPPAPAPTTKTSHSTNDNAYSARPYDKPKPTHTKAPSSIFSESSYAASQSTSRTTPPPSFRRGPYTTKDPDKIVIKAVYSFNNAFQKTPVTQLISGQGNVTDGLILRITTEGLFIDDDVRGVPQREWDVKAWTMKLVEVWCPSFRQGPAGNSASARVASASPKYNPVRRLWGMDKDKAATSEETDALLIDMLQLCQSNCRLRSTSSGSSAYSASSTGSYDDASSVTDSAYGSSVGNKRTNQRGANFQTGENKSAGLHVLRASIRDQEGKKYVFIISAEESWKVAVGLQRLRRGTQVRALGVSGMSTSDAKATLEHLQWIT
ncbi:hypothetical protein BGZ60DRAFT_493434 [Tricladium varicosporioides]|nr:hypothetical protein BGZ60DRAFT_493434 [Hymenoscyphus varicosporioides]